MRTLWFKLVLSLALLALGAGCSNGDPTPSNTNTMAAPDLQSAQQLAARSVAHCTDSSQCSPSVGMLIGTTTKSAYQCTAFLVASDIVATNSHCVPDDLKSAGSNCVNRIALVFPDVDGYRGERAGCSEVISASQIDSTTSHPDYAFLKLETDVSRPALQITHSGLNDSTTYTAYKMDPYQGNGYPEGYLHEARCKAVYGSMAASKSDTAQAGVMAIADCSVIHGNSGSPLLDASGQVPAIVFATLDQKALKDTTAKLTKNGLPLLDSSVAQMGLATNYACLSAPTDSGSPLPDACSSQPDSATLKKDLTAQFEARLKGEVQARTQSDSGEEDPVFDWTLTVVSGKRTDPASGLITDDAASETMVAVPKCYLNQQALLGPETQSSGSYVASYNRQMTIPYWSLQEGLNRYLQVDFQISEAPSNMEQIMELRFNPQTLATQGQSPITVTDALGLMKGTAIYSGTLAACPQNSTTTGPQEQ